MTTEASLFRIGQIWVSNRGTRYRVLRFERGGGTVVLQNTGNNELSRRRVTHAGGLRLDSETTGEPHG